MNSPAPIGAGGTVSSSYDGKSVPVATVGQVMTGPPDSPLGLTTVPATFSFGLFAPGGNAPTAIWDGRTAIPTSAAGARESSAPSNGSAVSSSSPAAVITIASGATPSVLETSALEASSTVDTAQTSSSAAAIFSASNTGLSGGAVGGIAAACIVGAALIAALLTWAIMRNRLKHYRNLAAGAAAGGGYDGTGAPEKTLRSSLAPVAAGADIGFLSGILPPASDDKEVKQRVYGMFEAAAIHVDNFYDNTKVGVPAEVAGQLAQFDSPNSPKTTSEMLSQGMKPKVIITRALTEMLVSCVDPQAPSSSSLLPTEYTALPNSLHGTGRDMKSRQDGPAIFWWRQLSVHLGPKTQENKTYLETRAQAIGELISNFQTTFRPWRKTKYTEKQETDALVGTFTSAADTGVWLFSQRSTFSFLWGRTVPPGEIETRPTLVKTSDANGQPLSKPREVVQRHLERTGSGAL